jgi:hypothetical protein
MAAGVCEGLLSGLYREPRSLPEIPGSVYPCRDLVTRASLDIVMPEMNDFADLKLVLSLGTWIFVLHMFQKGFVIVVGKPVPAEEHQLERPLEWSETLRTRRAT